MALRLSLNGESREFPSPLTVAELLRQLELDPAKVAVERNLEIVPKSAYQSADLSEGDKLEIVHFIGGGAAATEPLDSPLIVAGRAKDLKSGAKMAADCLDSGKAREALDALVHITNLPAPDELTEPT